MPAQAPKPDSRTTRASSVGGPGATRLAEFIDACGGAEKHRGEEAICRCPAHDDRTPSLSVRLGDDERLLVHCHAGCKFEDILKAVDWSKDQAKPPKTKPAKPRRRARTRPPTPHLEASAAAAALARRSELVEFYVYQDEAGREVGLVARILKPNGDKVMPQARCAEDGTWLTGTGQSLARPCPLYRLPELLAAAPEDPVLIPEGERMVDKLRSLGFLATCTSMGAGKAKHTDLSALDGRTIYLFPDNDEAGANHMWDLAARAYDAGAETVRIVKLPDLPEKGDVVDYCRARENAGLDDTAIASEIHDAMAQAEDAARDAAELDERNQVDPGVDQDDKARTADLLVALASDATLFHTTHDEPYALIRVDDHNEIWRIGCERFERWLRNRFYRSYGKAAAPASIATAIGQLQAMAQFDGDKHAVHTRIARVNNVIWVDLCNDNWQAVEITPTTWRVVDEPPVWFTRKPGMKPLPTPTAGLATLDPLFDLLHFNDDLLRLLVTAWIVNAIVPSSSYPILALSGEQGSGKTTFSRVLQRIIDPHEMEGRSPPRNEEDIAVAAQHAHLISYENLSGISSTLSDALCRVATGAGFAGRKLFTNDEERQLVFCRPLIINGIDDLATRSDLADRIVSVQLEPIPKAARRTEAELWSAFRELAPGLVGAVFGLVSEVIATGNLDVPLERMAEYSQVGAKVALALGREPTVFSSAYRENRDAASLTALESSSIGLVLLRFVSKGPFRGLVSGLLRDLQKLGDVHERRHPDWPDTPRKLGSELRRLSPNLARMGVTVRFLGHQRDGHWVEVFGSAEEDGHDGHNGHGKEEAK